MSYARSPRPSLVITVGMRCIWLPPWCKANSSFQFRRWVGHRQVGAEVGHAAQRFQRQRSGGEAELDRRVVRPGALVRFGSELTRELGVDVRGVDAERVGDGD